MNIGFVDTSWERNLQRVSPFLGVILIAAFAYFMFTMLRNAMTDLSQSVHTEAPLDVTGTIRLAVPQPLAYGDKVSFRSTVSGITEGTMSYITLACFQGDTLVYQRSVQQGVNVYLKDQYERDLVWDSGNASCSATLLYRSVGASAVDVYVLDALSFDVQRESSE